MSFFNDIFRVLQREWDRIRRFPLLPTVMFVLPVLSFVIFAALLSIGVPRDMPIAVLDEDNTELSRTLVQMIEATPSAHIQYKISDMIEGDRLLKQGRILAIYHIPRDFQKDILGNVGTRTAAYISGLNISANGLLNKDLQTATTSFSTGVTVQVLVSQGLSQEQAFAQALPVYFDSHVLFNPYVNYGYYLMPSFLPLMLMVFTLLSTILAIGLELKNATAGEWMAAARDRIWPALIGKMLPYTAAMFLMNLLMNTIMYKWMEVPLNGSAGILVFAGFLFVLAYQSIGVMFIAVLTSLRQALSIGGGYSVIAFTFSGLTFPLLAMSGYLRIISYIFPFTIYTDIFIDQAMRGAPVVYSVWDLGWLMLYVILPLLFIPRLKKVATHEKFWRKL